MFKVEYGAAEEIVENYSLEDKNDRESCLLNSALRKTLSSKIYTTISHHTDFMHENRQKITSNP